MKISWPKFALLLLCCAAIAFEVWHFRGSGGSTRQIRTPIAQQGKPGFALLPDSEIPGAIGYFISSKPRAESWEPTLGDIEDAEGNLSQISALSRLDPNPADHIDNPRQYFRQYLAVVVNGKRTIFINAFAQITEEKMTGESTLFLASMEVSASGTEATIPSPASSLI